MLNHTYDIFKGRFRERDVLWLGCIEGLGAAVDRMKVIAAKKPGSYFLFDFLRDEMVAAVDTNLGMESESLPPFFNTLPN